jgi:hypothetical protein
LQIINALLPLIAQKVPLLTDCLDDLMASTIRAIETKKAELHEHAYPTLSLVVQEFRFRRTDGEGRLLDLYEPNFSLATRYAFPNAVEVASGFLVDYLDFAFDRFEKNKQGIFGMLEGYVAGMSRVTEKTSGFFCVASKICVLARSIPEVFENLANFLERLSQSLDVSQVGLSFLRQFTSVVCVAASRIPPDRSRDCRRNDVLLPPRNGKFLRKVAVIGSFFSPLDRSAILWPDSRNRASSGDCLRVLGRCQKERPLLKAFNS